MLVGLGVLKRALYHLGVLLLDGLEVLDAHDGARTSAVDQDEKLVELLADGDGLLPALTLVVPEEDLLVALLVLVLLAGGDELGKDNSVSDVVVTGKRGVSTGVVINTSTNLYFGPSHSLPCLSTLLDCILVSDWVVSVRSACCRGALQDLEQLGEGLELRGLRLLHLGEQV